MLAVAPRAVSAHDVVFRSPRVVSANRGRAVPGMRYVRSPLLVTAALALMASAACGSTQPSGVAAVTASSTSGPVSTPSATLSPIALQTVAPTAAPTVPPTAQPVAPTGRPVVPTARPTAVPTPRPTTPPRSLCGAPANPWNYNFCGGGTISSPPNNFCDYFSCIPSFWQSTKGYVEECQDGAYSHSGGRSGSCSSHGGNLRPLNP